MNKTKIAWADLTWNPVTGCTPVSEGCANCYAERMAWRFAPVRCRKCDRKIGEETCSYPDQCDPKKDHFKVTLHPERLDQPLKRRKPARIFVCSMSDLFHPDVPDEFIFAVFMTMVRCLQHTFMVLTKRPERMRNFILDTIQRGVTWREGVTGRLTNNIWLGVTAENQARADERIPLLLQTPAAKRFVSIEPMLGPVNLTAICEDYNWVINALDWLIVGGETGPGARECKESWIYGLHDQCIHAQVPFFFKQRGKNWTPSVVGAGMNWERRREFPECRQE